jgi:2-succinyl-6-hydroxy-2,4-cyclohexadiene-1-carboxylate synthase
MKMALKALKGHSMNVERSGTGTKTIIAVHGFTRSAAMWNAFVEEAGTEYSIVCPELLGHGKSDSPDDPRLYDMKHTVNALAEILDRLEIEQAHWLGYSLGGRVALAAAVDLPERAISLTIESGSAGIENVKERKERKASDDALAGKIEQGTIQEFVDYWEKQALFGSQTRLPLETKQQLRAERLENNTKGLANSLRGIGVGTQTPLYEKLRTVTFPCLFVVGHEDYRFTETARKMLDLAPRGQVFITSDAGHAVHLEQPEIFNRTVLRFIRMCDHLRDTDPGRPGSQPSR